MTKMSDYYGEVSVCRNCKNAEGIAEDCKHCFSRGYLAQCMNCNGTGQFEAPMAGGPGTMKSTCAPCGGTGHFGVNKPEGWVEEPAKQQEITA